MIRNYESDFEKISYEKWIKNIKFDEKLNITIFKWKKIIFILNYKNGNIIIYNITKHITV